MEIRFTFQHEQIGLRINSFPSLLVGSQIEGRLASTLGWTGKTKGLSQRFMVLFALLALARKLPSETQQQLSIYCDDSGNIRLDDLRRFSPFSGTASCSITKRDICNHFHLSTGSNDSFLSLQSLNRGDHGSDQLCMNCAPDDIQFESAKQIFQWLVGFIEFPALEQATESQDNSNSTGLRPDWQIHVDELQLSKAGFSPRRPIDHPLGFFGRNYEIRSLFSWLSRTPLQNTAILGPRISGKTSLLRHIFHINMGISLRPDQQAVLPIVLPRFSMIYIDFEMPRMQQLPGLQKFILSSLGIDGQGQCQLDRFVDILSEKIQTPTVLIMDNISAGMKANSQKSDEFSLGDVFWDSMRALVSTYTNGKLAFIVSAREETEALASKYHYSSSFFNIFRSLRLGPLSNDAAVALVDKSPIPFSGNDKDWILRLCRGWPGLLQIACDRCLEAMQNKIPTEFWRAEIRREIEAAAASHQGIDI